MSAALLGVLARYAVLWAAWGVVAVSAARAINAGHSRERWREASALWLLFAAALALRVWCATWGPGDFFAKQWESIGTDSLTDGFDRVHGNAPRALWAVLFLVLPESDRTIVCVGLLLGSAATVVLVRTLRLWGEGRVGAYSAGLMLALEPTLVRFSGDQSRVSLVVFLATFALWALARHRASGGLRDLVAFGASALLCCRTRPEAGVILVVALLAIVVVHPTRPWRLRERALRDELVVLGLVGLLAAGGILIARAHGGTGVSSPLADAFVPRWVFTRHYTAWLSPQCTPPVLAAFGLGSVALGAVRGHRTAIWAVAGLLAVTQLTASGAVDPPNGDLLTTQVRYRALSMVAFATATGVGFGHVVRWITRRRNVEPVVLPVAIFAVAVAAVSMPTIRAVSAPLTVDEEYAFIRRALPELPECATLYWPVDPRVDLNGPFRTPRMLSAILGRGDWHEWPLPEPGESGTCAAFYYRSTACALDRAFVARDYPEALPLFERCAEGLARAGDRPVITAELVDAPSGGERFAELPIRVGFYALSD